MPVFPTFMFSQQTQRMLVLYFSATIFLNCFLVWRSAPGIANGLSDFAIFYTAGKIVHDNRGKQLYDLSLQQEVQRAFVPVALRERGKILPYNHPPFEADAFLFLANFSYHIAYVIWFMINVGLLIAALGILRKNLPLLGQMPLYLWTAACLAFTPFTVTLIQGQDSIVLLFFYCLAFASLRKNSGFTAGAWIGFGLFRFQLSVPLISFWLLSKRKRILAGFAVVGVLLTILSARIVGAHTLWNYPRYVWAWEHNLDSDSLFSVASRMPNLRGLVSVIPHANILLTFWIVLATVAVLLTVGIAVRPLFKCGFADLKLLFAISLLTALLLGYHTWTHDLSILFPGLLVISEEAASGTLASWPRAVSLFCIMLLWSPLTIICIHFQSLELLAAVMLVLLGSVIIYIRRNGSFPRPICD